MRRRSHVARDAFDGIRVLIVDDNATNRRILRLQLEAFQMNVSGIRLATRGARVGRARRPV